MKKYKVGIYTLGKVFLVNGRQVRTPFETTVYEKDIENFRIKIRTEAIDKYSIEELIDNPKPTIESLNISDANNILKKIKSKKTKKERSIDPKIEEFTSNPKSLLSKYSSGEL